MRFILFTSFVIGCTSTTSPVASVSPTEPMPETPSGFTEASHGRGEADYSILMGDGDVPRLDIVMTAESFDTIQDDLEDLTAQAGGGPGGPGGGNNFPDAKPVYVPVTLSMGDQIWPQVGFRYKGNSTLYSASRQGVEKLPFRLSLDYYEDDFPELEDQRFYGFKDLKFSSGYNDTTLQRDKLTSDTFRAAGIPAAKGGFVAIYIDTGNGPTYWGLYTVFEDPAGKLLDSWFGDDSGNAYKPDGDGATLEQFVEADLEKKTNELEADFSDIQAVIAALNAPRTDAQAWRDGLDAVFDTDGFLDYLALNNLIGNWDAYGRMTHNYYLYADPSDGRLTWVPWDFNEAYASGSGQRGPVNMELTNIGDGWPLLEYVADDPVYRAAYDQKLQEHLANAFSSEAQATQIESNRARIAAFAAMEQAPYTAQNGNFDTATNTLATYVENQRAAAP